MEEKIPQLKIDIVSLAEPESQIDPKFQTDQREDSLHIFGMIKRVPGTYRCYLTKLGRAATAAGVHATEFNILPTPAAAA